MPGNKTELTEIKQHCLQFLSRREYSSHELLHKLSAKGYAKELINEVLQAFAQQDWQSNTRFAESFCRDRINKGYGPLRISSELQQRGIDDFQMQDLITEMELNWAGIIERVYLKKYSVTTTVSRKEWAKRTRFLQQRGFTFAMIQTLFKQLAIKLLD